MDFLKALNPFQFVRSYNTAESSTANPFVIQNNPDKTIDLANNIYSYLLPNENFLSKKEGDKRRYIKEFTNLRLVCKDWKMAAEHHPSWLPKTAEVITVDKFDCFLDSENGSKTNAYSKNLNSILEKNFSNSSNKSRISIINMDPSFDASSIQSLLSNPLIQKQLFPTQSFPFNSKLQSAESVLNKKISNWTFCDTIHLAQLFLDTVRKTTFASCSSYTLLPKDAVLPAKMDQDYELWVDFDYNKQSFTVETSENLKKAVNEFKNKRSNGNSSEVKKQSIPPLTVKVNQLYSMKVVPVNPAFLPSSVAVAPGHQAVEITCSIENIFFNATLNKSYPFTSTNRNFYDKLRKIIIKVEDSAKHHFLNIEKSPITGSNKRWIF